MLKPKKLKKSPKIAKSISNLDNLLSKKRNRKAYSAQRYQTKKKWYHEWYLKRKSEQKKQEQEQLSQHSRASAYQILISLKEYTELNLAKRKLWLNFIWTLQELNETGSQDIIQIMKLQAETDKLIQDYWKTAKAEIQRGKSWNSLSEEKKQKLVQYWGQEKVRKENSLEKLLKNQQERGQSYYKEIWEMVDISTFHEERGKIKCKCYQCARAKEKLKAEMETFGSDGKVKKSKIECSECSRWVKELDEENGLCKKCVESYEEV